MPVQASGHPNESYELIKPSGERLCRYCGKTIMPEQEGKTSSYWHIASTGLRAGPLRDVCHEDCKRDGERREAYQCQCIDTNCNDCLYFERDLSYIQPRGTAQWEISFPGNCRFFNRPETGSPNYCDPTKTECFVHRRSSEAQ